MKFILVPILMLLILAQTFSKWLVIAEYNLNKDYISKNLCINKTKPKLHCNGKCFMMKKMAEDEKQTPANNNSGFKIKTVEIICNEFASLYILPLEPVKNNFHPYYSFAKYSSPVASIFHPPALA